VIDSDRLVKLTQAIELHLSAVGPRKWALIRAQFPEVSAATFWRKVKTVRQQVANPPDAVAEQKALPSTSPPLTDLEEIRSLIGHYSFLRQATRFRELLADADTLKTQSVNKDGKITNHTAYTKSIVIRERLVNSELDMLDRFWSIQNMEVFYDTMLETLEKVSPEYVRKLLDALKALPRKC
jgi:hypothetical protein